MHKRSLTRRAHMAGQTNVQRQQKTKIQKRTHLSASHVKAVARGPTKGSAGPWVDRT